MQSCMEGITVSCPMRRATSWSSDVPTYRSAPMVCLGCDCVRNTALERKWSPPISGALNGSAMRTSVLLTMVRYFRHGASDGSAPSGISSKFRPTPAGAQRFFDAPQVFEPAAPCTDSMQTSRVLSAAAAPAPSLPRARSDGCMASRYGSATVAPRLWRNVRRGRGVRVWMCMCAAPGML